MFRFLIIPLIFFLSSCSSFFSDSSDFIPTTSTGTHLAFSGRIISGELGIYPSILLRMKQEWDQVILWIDCQKMGLYHQKDCEEKQKEVEFQSILSLKTFPELLQFQCNKLRYLENKTECEKQKEQIVQWENTKNIMKQARDWNLIVCNDISPEKEKQDDCKITAILTPTIYKLYIATATGQEMLRFGMIQSNTWNMIEHTCSELAKDGLTEKCEWRKAELKKMLQP